MSSYRMGDKVNVLVEGAVVGQAELKVRFSITEDELLNLDKEECDLRRKFCRVLHLHDVRNIEAGKEILVVIRNVTIDTTYADVEIPYTTPGVEEGTDTLGDMNPSCFYLWDLNNMKRVV